MLAARLAPLSVPWVAPPAQATAKLRGLAERRLQGQASSCACLDALAAQGGMVVGVGLAMVEPALKAMAVFLAMSEVERRPAMRVVLMVRVEATARAATPLPGCSQVEMLFALVPSEPPLDQQPAEIALVLHARLSPCLQSALQWKLTPFGCSLHWSWKQTRFENLVCQP